MKQFSKRTYSYFRNNRHIDRLIDRLIKVREKCHEINELVKIIGLSSFLKKLIYSRHEEILQEIDLNKVASFPSSCKLDVHNIQRQHIPRLALFRKQAGIGDADPAEGLEEYLDHGCKGFVAELEGEIIGYIWWGDYYTDFSFDPQKYEYYLKEARVTPADTYGFDFFIMPIHRGQGKSLAILSTYLLALRDLGYKKNYGYVRVNNTAALWIYKIIGCKDIKRIVVRRFFLFFLFKNLRYFYDKNGLKWLFDVSSVSAVQ